VKVLLKRLHLNGHTVRFHLRTQKLEAPLVNVSLTDSGSFYLKKLKNTGRYLATYVALLGVEIWDPFRGVPNWILICINEGVNGVCVLGWLF